MGGVPRSIPVLIILTVMMKYSSSLVSGMKGSVLVTVHNNLGPGKKLHLQCESKDDDLGEKALDYNQEYSWRFADNLWWSTLFYCDLWYERNGAYVATHADVYVAKRDEFCTGCVAAVGLDGIHVVDRNNRDSKLVATWP
ncbi:S-protein homolog 29-like [Macadamia integrifolia]|uniref:S-protein homolog 29-like n=1 Tax=Macadamia integrifolia TaxID=60698 RepID=UPI001C4E667A|nr:S-protein homolog 29-like [Macadamia integrifolia]